MISRIGNEKYGLWSLVLVVTTYFGLADFGAGWSFVKYVSEFHSKKDYTRLNKLINTGFGFYTLFSIAIFAVALIFLDPILHFLDIPMAIFSEARFVFILGLATFLLIATFYIFSTVLTGLQRMDLYNRIMIGTSILKVAGYMIVLEKGFGLIGMMASDFFVTWAGIGLTIWQSRRLFPQLEFRPWHLDREIMKTMFRFGSKLQVNSFSEQINFHLDKILISRFVGLSFVTFYDVGAKILFKLRAFPFIVLSSVTPAVSELNAKQDERRLKELYLRASKYLVLLGAGTFMLIFVAAHHLVNFWVGAGYQQTVRTMQLLCAGYFLNTTTAVVGYTAQGIGKPEYQMRAAFLQASLNIVLSVSLILQFGYWGTVLGTIVALTLGAFYFIIKFNRVLNLSLKEYMKRIFLAPLLASVVSAALTFLFDQIVWQRFIHPITRMSHAWLLLMSALFFLISYGMLIKVFHFLDERDWSIVRDASLFRL